MNTVFTLRRAIAAVAIVSLGAGVSPLLSSTTASATPRKAGRYIVKAKSDADLADLKAELQLPGQQSRKISARSAAFLWIWMPLLPPSSR